MTIPPETIAIYQQGGTAYAFFEKNYGTSNADIIASAAASGDRATLTDAIAQVKWGNPLNDSTVEILAENLITDPLGAPLDALDAGVNQLFNSTGLKTIAVVVVAGLVIFVIVKYSD